VAGRLLRTVDVVVIGGKIVSEFGILENVGIAIESGRIASIACPSHLPSASTTIDASSKLVIPGVVDAHCHSQTPGFNMEDYEHVTAAAAAGGVTTLQDHPINIPPTTTAENMRLKLSIAQRESYVDFCLLGGVLPENLQEISRLAELGVTGYKAPMVELLPDTVPKLSDGELFEAFQTISATSLRVGVHAENEQIISHLTKKLRKLGRRDPLAHIESRPPISEYEAVRRAVLLAREVGCKLHIFHLSIPEGAEAVRSAGNEGLDASCETCPHYLLLDSESMIQLAGLAKINPPLRDKTRIAKLWEALREGSINIVASDHAPFFKEEKMKEDVFEVPAGIPSVQTMLPLMLSEGVGKGRLTMEKLTEILCSGPAKLFSIYPKKGVIRVGSDADIVVLDLKSEDTIRSDGMHYKVGWTPYDGWKVKGRIEKTIVRGEVVAEKGEITGSKGHGEFVTPKTKAEDLRN